MKQISTLSLESSKIKQATRLRLLIILVCCSLYAQFVSCGYIPLLPIIAKSYTETTSHTQLLVTFFLLGFASAQIFAGTFADYFGRRHMVLTGITISVIGSLFCVLSPSLFFLFLAFYCQAFGIGFVIPIENVMISESDRDPEKSKIGYGIINTALCVGSILAPMSSSFIADHFFVKLSFSVCLIVGLVIFFIALKYLPETAEAFQKEAFGQRVKSVFMTLFSAFKGRPIFTAILFYSASLTAVTAAFNTAIPIILSIHYHLATAKIGLCFMAVNILSTAGLIAAFSLAKFKRNSVILMISSITFIIASTALPVLRSFITEESVWLLTPYFVIIFVMGLVTPVVWYIALNYGEIPASQAAALIIFWQNIFSVISSLVVSYLDTKTQIPVACIFLVFFFIALISAIKYLRIVKRGIIEEVDNKNFGAHRVH